MKIILVIPPSPFLLDERVFISIGILKVGAMLERAGHQVECIDCSGVVNYLDMFEGRHADWWLLTATTPQMPSSIEIAAKIRACDPGSKIMLGGPHPTLTAAAKKIEAKRAVTGRAARAWDSLLETFDCTVSGDGEFAVFEALKGEQRWIDADDPRGALFLTDQQFNDLPMPSRHLVDVMGYYYSIEGARATNIIAQLGCPFNCGFCGGRDSAMLRRIRNRSTESVLAEMEHLFHTYGMRGFMFQDDELNVNKDIVQLMNGIELLGRRLKVDWRLRGFIKSELFTDEQAEAMFRAGFRQILTGYESGNERILTNINKKATKRQNEEHMRIAHRHGLKVKALMSIGHPGETPETCNDTMRFVIDNRADDFDVTIITPYPGSPYYDQAEESMPGVWTYTQPKTGDRLHAFEVDYNVVADYYKSVPGASYKSYVFTDAMTPGEIVSTRDVMEDTIRKELNLPYPVAAQARRFEHSMGQMGK
jgi:radical SAM superfamily enzyme YgiQ (UPF0313 family)